MPKLLYVIFPILLFANICTANSGISFIENKGQWEKNILYRANIPSGVFFVEANTLTYLFYDREALHHLHHHQHEEGNIINSHAVKINFLNANPSATPESFDTTITYYNYFIGNDPSKWASDVKAYQKIFIRNLYQGVDLEIISLGEAMKMNFHLKPGVNPSIIRMQYDGMDDLNLVNGRLEIQTSITTITEKMPVSFQERRNETREIATSFEVKDNVVQFKTANYNRRLPLIIDPIVVFSTFSGSLADNFGFTATYDSLGNAYSGGTVYGPNFPTSAGAFQTVFKDGVSQGNELARDGGILKFSSDGTQLLWATYLGGSNNEQPHSMVVNKDGNLVIFGTTASSNFPTSPNAFDRFFNGGWDIYVFILSGDGRNMIASTFIGGSDNDGLNGNPTFSSYSGGLAYNYGDYYRGEVIVDNDNNIYIATSTQSSPTRGFPIINGFNSNFRGSQAGVVIKLNHNLSNILWSSYISGSSQDAAYGITLGIDGDIYVAGGTTSSDMQIPSNSFQPAYGGNVDGFICRIDPNGTQLKAFTYFGTTAYDQAYFVQADLQGRIYLTGQTRGARPITPGVYGNPGASQFMAMFTPELDHLIKYTTFGPPSSVPNLSPSAFLVDVCGRIYFSGWGGGANNHYNPATGNTRNFPLSGDAFQTTTNGSDFYLIILDKEFSNLVYGTYFGGNRSEEHVDGGTSRFDKNGIVYQSVCAGCGGHSDFPTTPNAHSRENKGRRPSFPPAGGCNNAVFKIDMNSSNFVPEFQDVVLHASVLEELVFDFQITDRDPMDSLFFTWSGDIFNPAIYPNPAVMKADSGRSPINGQLRFTPTCETLKNDTLIVKLHIRDDGCPTPRTRVGTIKIVVEKPPIPNAPEMFCLQRRGEDILELSWDEFELNKYISHYRLMKRFPDGTEVLLDSIISVNQKSITDNNAPNHRTTDYCYYIYGVNICGEEGPSTRIECSIPHKDSIPVTSTIYTVTVEDNRNIRVIWTQNPHDDFYSYQIFRRENLPGTQFQPYKVIRGKADTTFLDTAVNVHTTSYCYMVVVNDQCGIESVDNDYGCSILLQGTSEPFEHTINWIPYQDWSNGIKNYEIIRSDAYTPPAQLNIVPSNQLTYNDRALNHDVGLYYYTVVANENIDKYPAQSMSNTIELVQAPLLHIPNAFSPNHDTINDLWNMMPVFVKDFELKIFTRWGEQVFVTNNKHQKWDGKYKGTKGDEFVFVYIITFTGWDKSVHYRSGNVTIIK